MGIAFVCERCDRRHQVDASHAGRRGRCKGCGHVFTVPAAAEAYALEEPPAVGASAFARVARGEAEPPTRSTAPGSEVPRVATRRRREQASQRARVVRRIVRGGLIAAGVLLAVAIVVPGGTMLVGIGLAIAGLLLVAVGYAIAAYAVFSEDSLYGWLFLLIPLYAGYYLVTNFDVMWPWLSLILAGLAVLVVAAWIMGAGLERAGAGGALEDVEEEVRVVEPGGGRFVHLGRASVTV